MTHADTTPTEQETPGRVPDKHQEDLVRRVGDAGQRVAGEDGQRHPFRQQRLVQLSALQLATDQQTLTEISKAHA
jgi:hypothetical protein